ncbi:hypothetical protein Zmor_017277 [Zophobas morio]|uniref:Uncharacterized protein n=1 Tax=Zophobas morio TaxID=2755281 RepID=A0AA38I9B3_9CUCU|nr:hypothetical protein Zmor_017277 [Zophobas morio]
MNSVIILCVLFVVCGCVKMPSTFQKCAKNKSDFNQCLLKAVENAVHQLNHPMMAVGLVSLEPLEVSSINISPGTGAAQFTQIYKNVKVYGFSKAKFSEFDFDFNKETITFECSVSNIRVEGEYDFKGRIMVIPFNGKGSGVITLDDVNFVFTFNLDEYDKNGEKYYKIKESTLVAVPQLIHFQLDNLFGEDEALGKHLNDVFNENWKVLWDDVGSSYEEAFNQLITHAFGRFLEKVPVSEIFE